MASIATPTAASIVELCLGCKWGPCSIALMPGEMCTCEEPGCECHGPLDGEVGA